MALNEETIRARRAEFEHYRAGEFYDLLWPGRCLIEMKASAEKDRLSQHRPQALRYWENAAAPDSPHPLSSEDGRTPIDTDRVDRVLIGRRSHGPE